MGVDREHAKAVGAAMQAAMDSPEREVEISGLDGRPIRIIKTPEPGIKARIEILSDESYTIVTTMWEPATDRPPAYPQDVPFVPNVEAGTTTIGARGQERTQAQWFTKDDPSALLAHLVDVSLADGWEHAPVQPSTPAPMQMISLRRGTAVRFITCVTGPQGAMVTFVDSSPREEP